MMNKIIFENIFDRERFYSTGEPASKIVDGVIYVKVSKESNHKEAFIRQDALRIVLPKQKATKYM
jgi:hypothetical protein